MRVEADRSPQGTLDRGRDPSEERLGEERANRILERAADLDAKRNSEIEVNQLREAASAAGISPEAFDQAIREDATDSENDRGAGQAPEVRPATALTAPGAAEVAHYAGLLRDLLGDDAEVVVVEDRIEARGGEGMRVSVNPSSGDATAAILAEGSLRRRLIAIALPAVIPLTFGLVLAMDEEEAGVGLLVGMFLAVIGSLIATLVSDRRERRALRKKAERLRRQLQRMLGPGMERD